MIGQEQARVVKAHFNERYGEPGLAVGLSHAVNGTWSLAVRTSRRPDLPAYFEGLAVEVRVLGTLKPLAASRRRA